MIINSGRINDPLSIDPAEVAAAAASREWLVIQFSEPGTYPERLLHEVNEACRLAGAGLQVRF